MGPDAARYLLAGRGVPVAKPFHLRWLLPAICGDVVKRWWIVWWGSWPLLFVGMLLFAQGNHLSTVEAFAAAVALVALPGVLGPQVVRPVGVDLPAMALTVIAAGLFEQGYWIPALIVVGVASMIKETAPIWMALWVWNPVVLGMLIIPLTTALLIKPQMDEVTRQPHLKFVHDHPVKSALAAHMGKWRNAQLWVEPWGGMVVAVGNLNLRLMVTLLLAHAQTLVATDTVRLVQTAAGPVVAIAAVQALPVQWVWIVPLVCVMWWRKPEMV